MAGSDDSDSNGPSVWKQLPSGRMVHRLEWVVLVATLALIPVLVIESDAKSDTWQNVATAANWTIWAIFLAELAFVLTVGHVLSGVLSDSGEAGRIEQARRDALNAKRRAGGYFSPYRALMRSTIG